MSNVRTIIDTARAVKSAFDAVGGSEGLRAIAPEMATSSAIVSALASSHRDPRVRTVWASVRAAVNVSGPDADLGLRVAEALERARRERDDAHARAEAAILNLNVPREDSK
jgi:hypothetical protein